MSFVVIFDFFFHKKSGTDDNGIYIYKMGCVDHIFLNFTTDVVSSTFLSKPGLMGKSQKRVKLIFLKVTFTKFDAVTLSGHPKNQLEKTQAQNSTEKEGTPSKFNSKRSGKMVGKKDFCPSYWDSANC